MNTETRPEPISSGWIVFWVVVFWPAALIVASAKDKREREIVEWEAKNK